MDLLRALQIICESHTRDDGDSFAIELAGPDVLVSRASGTYRAAWEFLRDYRVELARLTEVRAAQAALAKQQIADQMAAVARAKQQQAVLAAAMEKHRASLGQSLGQNLGLGQTIGVHPSTMILDDIEMAMDPGSQDKTVRQVVARWSDRLAIPYTQDLSRSAPSPQARYPPPRDLAITIPTDLPRDYGPCRATYDYGHDVACFVYGHPYNITIYVARMEIESTGMFGDAIHIAYQCARRKLRERCLMNTPYDPPRTQR